MNDLLDTFVRNQAHGHAHSALPTAPVVAHKDSALTVLRGRVGAALHGSARRVEPTSKPTTKRHLSAA